MCAECTVFLSLRDTTVKIPSSCENKQVNRATSQLYHINIKSRQPLSEGKTSRNVTAVSFPYDIYALRVQNSDHFPFLANTGRRENRCPRSWMMPGLLFPRDFGPFAGYGVLDSL